MRDHRRSEDPSRRWAYQAGGRGTGRRGWGPSRRGWGPGRRSWGPVPVHRVLDGELAEFFSEKQIRYYE